MATPKGPCPDEPEHGENFVEATVPCSRSMGEGIRSGQSDAHEPGPPRRYLDEQNLRRVAVRRHEVDAGKRKRRRYTEPRTLSR